VGRLAPKCAKVTPESKTATHSGPMGTTRTSAEPGNELAVSHGATSPRIVAARTAAILAEWADPESGLQLTAPADRAALYAVASAYARLQELTEWFEGPDSKGQPRGMLDNRGRPRGCARLYWTALNATMSGLRQIGATPAGRAEMAQGVAAASGFAAQLAARRRGGR
jgi:hypothetical protein